MSTLFEANVDGLVGPTHNYAGLSYGNEAAMGNAGNVSNPRGAALQGLQKMRLLTDLGLRQMVMPPHPRPNLAFLRNLGFKGVADAAPELLPYIYSASGMWAANAATVAPATDTPDGKAHFTPANLICTAHRAIEPAFSSRALKRLFPSPAHFTHHDPLPANLLLADEGAANHMRLTRKDGTGLHVFVYGREQLNLLQYTKRYPARQTLPASQAVARLHGIKNPVFIRQTGEVIDAGVFHNDVIATSNGDVLLYHEEAFVGGDAPVKALGELRAMKVATKDLSVESAVKSYLFNSQVVSLPGGGMAMIAPGECEHHNQARSVIDSLGFKQVHFMDLRESMRNGGGPACLRLRVQLTEEQWKHVHPGVVFTPDLHKKLSAWVEKHYRDKLQPADLREPKLADEALAAYAALEKILDLPGLYEH